MSQPCIHQQISIDKDGQLTVTDPIDNLSVKVNEAYQLLTLRSGAEH